MRHTIASFVVSLITVGCATDAARSEAALQTPSDPSAQYRVVVVFGSAGTGVDLAAYEQTTNNYGKYDIDLTPDVFSWGLEGERNLCFTLEGLNAQAQGQFVVELNAIATTAQLLTVYENAACDVVAQ